MNKISFTVFIPCYGKCPHLCETLDSLLDQEYDLDILLCPQGDTDISKILKKYPSVRYIRLEKPSLYKARIFLFDKSNSDYIYFVDDDDIIPKGLFKYIDEIIRKTSKLDLYRIPLVEFNDKSDYKKEREQNFNFDFFFEGKKQFLAKCFDGTYHNGVVHLFVKTGLKPKWFDVDVFQTEDRLITYSIVESIKTDVCVIQDAFYLYRKYPLSHSRTLDYLKGRDDFIVVNDCLKEFMSDKDLIFNSNAIALRVVSYLKLLNKEKRFTRNNFNKIYSNERIWFYLKLFLKQKKEFRNNVGQFVLLITKHIYRRRYLICKILISLKCKHEIHKYGNIQF